MGHAVNAPAACGNGVNIQLHDFTIGIKLG
jgi:hypothetical protein